MDDLNECNYIGRNVEMSEIIYKGIANCLLIWITDADGACSFLNQNWYSFTGQAAGKGLGVGWIQAINADDRKLVSRLFLRANVKRVPFQMEYRLQRKDGSYLRVSNMAIPYFDTNGGFIGYVGLVKDIVNRNISDEVSALIMRGELHHAQILSQMERAVPGISLYSNHKHSLPALGISL